MVWTLLPHLTACVAGNGVMLLDLRQDRYYRVPPALTDETVDWLNRTVSAPPSRLLKLLETKAVVRASERSALDPNKRRVIIPKQLPHPAETSSMSLRGALSVTRHVANSWALLRTRSLHSLIATRRRRRGMAKTQQEAVSRETLLAYERARRWIPLRKNCLLDSLALDCWLGDRLPDRTLVFGVTLEPFLAHCWLQTPDVLLNESYDRVRRFTPILVA